MDAVFREIAPGEASSVRADGAWAYGANPAGSRAFAAFEGERLVAHCGAIGQRVWAGGRERRFAQLVDLVEERPGHLALVARGLVDEVGGPKDTVVLYGWPGPAEARIAERLLGFETVRTETRLVRTTGNGVPDVPADVEELERFDEQARWLFDRCAGDFGASAIRDAAFLDWRFVDRPGRTYRRLAVRDPEGVLRGYAVLDLEREDARLVDWLVPPEEPEVGEALVFGSLATARAAGRPSLATRLPPWSPWFERLQRWGFRAHRDEDFLLARGFTRRFDDLWLREQWWTTLADDLDA
jgi:hypothetical protein